MKDVPLGTSVTEQLLCYAMLCYAMLCYAMLCYAMLCPLQSLNCNLLRIHGREHIKQEHNLTTVTGVTVVRLCS